MRSDFSLNNHYLSRKVISIEKKKTTYIFFPYFSVSLQTFTYKLGTVQYFRSERAAVEELKIYDVGKKKKARLPSANPNHRKVRKRILHEGEKEGKGHHHKKNICLHLLGTP